MGWLNSPCIGQRTSLALLRETRSRLKLLGICDFYSTVWLDNFIFAANDFDILATILQTFQEVCAEANVQLHPPSEIAHEITILGFHIRLGKEGSIQHSEKWKSKVAKVFEAIHSTSVSFRDIARIVGCLGLPLLEDILWRFSLT